jgi:hypothetical protein
MWLNRKDSAKLNIADQLGAPLIQRLLGLALCQECLLEFPELVRVYAEFSSQDERSSFMNPEELRTFWCRNKNRLPAWYEALRRFFWFALQLLQLSEGSLCGELVSTIKKQTHSKTARS